MVDTCEKEKASSIAHDSGQASARCLWQGDEHMHESCT
jgi:hypothetical protein